MRTLSSIYDGSFLGKYIRSSQRKYSVKKIFLEISQNSQENTCARVSFFNKVTDLRPQACNLVKKETLAQVFYCEFCEISKNTFLQNTSGPLLLFLAEAFDKVLEYCIQRTLPVREIKSLCF